tara:strand:+ start:991 stop:1437 length:447 start_codon:yes stop_codon:yes gene_type:complete
MMDRILGLDYGTRRLGFAVSDPTGIIATSLETVAVQTDSDACQAVARLLRETGATSVVVGHPLHMNGSKSELALKVETFIERLRGSVDVPLHLWDERLSSREAERVLLEADTSRAKRKQVRDKMAAQLILQNYLDAQTDAMYRHPDDE